MEMLSLLDYLGKPAGKELGKKVYNVARDMHVKVESRNVITRKYSGSVMCYPVDFLSVYFKYNQA